MNFDDKLKELKKRKDQLNLLQEVIYEIESVLQKKKEYDKAEDKHKFLYKVSVFVKILRYCGVKKYDTNSGGHLMNHVPLDYDDEMMKEILVIVNKRYKNLSDELESLINL